MSWTNVLGGIGCAFSIVHLLPQYRLVWEHRNDPLRLSAISSGTQLFVIGNALTWFGYAWLTKAFWAGAPGVLNLPLAIWCLWLLRRVRRLPGQPETLACACGLWDANVAHDWHDTRGGYVQRPCRGGGPHGYAVVADPEVLAERERLNASNQPIHS